MTKVIATLGPASISQESIINLHQSGVSIFRLNLSHNNLDWHSDVIERVRKYAPTCSILADIPGRKIRTSDKVSEDYFKKGDILKLVPMNSINSSCVPHHTYEVNNNIIFSIAKVNTQIFGDDGTLSFNILSVSDQLITMQSLCSGILKARKGINLPASTYGTNQVSLKDKFYLDFCISKKIDFIGISFVDSSDYLENIHEYIRGNNTKAIAKIECSSAINHLEQIIKVSFGLMIDRGDLSVETNIQNIGILQKQILKKAFIEGVPVIVATETLHTMHNSLFPTKAECNDITNSTLDGAACLMLSGETAVGNYPLESVQMMISIIKATNDYQLSMKTFNKIITSKTNDTQPDIMAAGLNVISSNKMIRGVVCITKTGEGVKYLSKYISKEIICVCDSIFVSRMLNIYAHSKVFLLPNKFSSDNSQHIYEASKLLIKEGYSSRDLYAFIFVSGGGSGLRLNTIHINYLSTLADKC